jgi:pimeloyl-ACP methyl ester carboxylesterase
MIIDYKGVDVFYSDYGKGDTIVLLHGFLENSTMWKDLIPKISKSNRVISIDLLGHGDSGCKGYVHTMEMMAEAVAVVLNNLNLDKVTLIGHSMGGYVALAFIEMYPKKVNGLCLMNSTTVADTLERQINRDRAIAAVKQNHKSFISMSVSNLFAPDNRERFVKDIEKVKHEALKMPLQGIIAALEGMKIRKERTHLLFESSFKKMIILGRRDSVLDFETTIKEINKTNVEVVDFPDGHMSHIENIYELTYNILRFIEK